MVPNASVDLRRSWRRRRVRAAVGALISLGVLLIGLVASGLSAAAPRPKPKPKRHGVLITARKTRFGKVLFTSGGRALYLRSYDQLTGPKLPLHSTCTGTCAAIWPPLLVSGPKAPFVAAHGVKRRALGTVRRANGTYQVTYFGHPLYEFIRDTRPYAVSGENVASFDALWQLDSLRGAPTAGVATVRLEHTRQGLVLSVPTAFGTHRSLYALTYDLAHKVTCTGPCAAIWPPLLSAAKPRAGRGVNRRALGLVRASDGTRQVTYDGHPLYLFAFDLGAGAPSGLTGGEYLVDQHAHGVWWLLSPDGRPNPGPLTITSGTLKGVRALEVNPPSPFASRPFAVYSFSRDSAHMSACLGACARYWPPVLASGRPRAAAGSGLRQAGLGTIVRPDGTRQVTYDGHPLYFFAFDQPGQALGAGVAAFKGIFRLVGLNGASEL
jgi:predicted lipoprotein with Yx(FWY)xxD motif